MKAKIVLGSILLSVTMQTSYASDAWIKVDAQGNAIGGAIVCTNDVCGNPESDYSRLTLQPGERYVLQFQGNRTTGNVAGISAENPNIKLKVNLETNEWTQTAVRVVPHSISANEVNLRAVEEVSTWNPTKTPSTQIETTTVTKKIDVSIKPQVTVEESNNVNESQQTAWSFNWLNIFNINFMSLLAWIDSLWLQVTHD